MPDKNRCKRATFLTYPALADTLEAIMEEGTAAIYKGERAEKIAQEIQAAGGIITAEDLANYRPTLYHPLVTEPGEVMGFTMVGVPPPSSGGCVVIGAARLLSGYKEAMPVFDDTISEHRIVEAMKHAYAIRMSLSDPNFFANVTEAAVKDLMTGPYMESLRQTIQDDDVLHMWAYGGKKWSQLSDSDAKKTKLVMSEEGHDNRRLKGVDSFGNERRRLAGFQYLNDHGTTHFSIVDKDGNAFTMTSK
jgi:gamma-glutamyltranspeptidase